MRTIRYVAIFLLIGVGVSVLLLETQFANRVMVINESDFELTNIRVSLSEQNFLVNHLAPKSTLRRYMPSPKQEGNVSVEANLGSRQILCEVGYLPVRYRTLTELVVSEGGKVSLRQTYLRYFGENLSFETSECFTQ